MSYMYETMGEFSYFPLEVLYMILLELPPQQVCQNISPLSKRFHLLTHNYLFKKQQLNQYALAVVDKYDYVDNRWWNMIRHCCWECGKWVFFPRSHPFYVKLTICTQCAHTYVKYGFFYWSDMFNYLTFATYHEKGV
jgi:hypothetical protein